MNLIARGALGSSCGFCSTSYKDWPRRLEEILNLLAMAQWTFLYCRPSFIKRKRSKNCSAPLEHVQRAIPRMRIFLSAVLAIAFIVTVPILNKKALGKLWRALSHDEGREEFAKDLSASPFNEGISIYTAFNQTISMDSCFNNIKKDYRFSVSQTLKGSCL